MTATGDATTPGAGGDAPVGGQASRRSSQRPTDVVTLAALVVGLVAVAVVLGTGVASATVPSGVAQSGNDTAAPELGNLTAVDLTTLDLEVTDDQGVNESSIDTADFQLSAGTLSDVSTSENDTDAIVTMTLAQPIDQGELKVTIAEGGNITDDAGNELGSDDTIGRRVYEMDGVPPSVSLFSVDTGDGNVVDVSVETSESLEDITVGLAGPASVEMGIDDFSSAPGFDSYDGSITPPASGTYTVTLERVIDTAGNSRELNLNETATVDVTPPEARARVDYGNSNGLSVAFDASRSTDNNLLGTVTWAFGDGETAVGQRVTHDYEPGNYTVTATVSDYTGNTATEELLLTLTGDAIEAARTTNTTGASSVSINGGGVDSPTAMVDVTDAQAGASVTITRDVGEGTPIATSDTLTLGAMTVKLATNTSYGLGVQAEGPDAVSDVTAATDGDPLGALTVIHDVDDTDVANVSFEFGVDRGTVDASISDPDAVGLFRFHGGEWTHLETDRVAETNETYEYRARSPGLSRFAVATVPGAVNESMANETDDQSDDGQPPEEDDTDEQSVTVTNATLNTTSVQPGSAVGVTATVQNGGSEAAAFTAGLTIDGEPTETQLRRVPAGNSISVAFSHVPESTGSYALAVNGTAAGTLSVASDEEGDGSLLGFLGFLPIGLFKTVITYVGGVLGAIFLLLKAVALYLGY